MKIIKTIENREELFLATFRHLNIEGRISGMDIQTLTIMCLHARVNGNLPVSKNLREQFQKELNMTTQSLTNSIARLKNSGLVSGERGFYVLKPEALWEGTPEDRKGFLATEDEFEITIHNSGDQV